MHYINEPREVMRETRQAGNIHANKLGRYMETDRQMNIDKDKEK